MNVASLSLCRELYELSEWGDTGFTYCQSGSYREGYGDQSDKGWFAYDEDMALRHHRNKWPHLVAYGLGYLVRKLPKSIEHDGHPFDLTIQACGSWFASYDAKDGSGMYGQVCATPEDAACKLAIELFKQGVLSKQPNATNGMEGE